jgi:hypothetical protein
MRLSLIAQALQAQLQRFQQKEITSSSSSSNLKPVAAATAAAPSLNASAELSPVPVDRSVAEARAITIAR